MGAPGSGWAEQVRTLRRVREGKIIAGVCGGLGRATGTDPLMFRVLLAVLVFFGGVGGLLYLAAWLLLPADGDETSPLESLVGRGRSTTSPLLTIGMLIASVLLLAANLSSGIQYLLLLIACVVGGYLLLRRNTGSPGSLGSPAGAAMPGVPPGAPAGPPWAPPPWAPQPWAEAHTSAAPAAAPGTVNVQAPTGSGVPPMPPTPPGATVPPLYPPYQGPPQPGPAPQYAPGPAGYNLPFAPHGPWGAGPVPGPAPVVAPPRRPKRRRERSKLGRVTLSAGCVALAILALIDVSGASIPASGYFGVALTVVALGLLAGVRIGRARWLIVPGLFLTLALAASTVDGNSYNGDHAERIAPMTLAEVLPKYDNGSGDYTLDFRNVDFGSTPQTIEVDQGFGDLRIQLPPNVDVAVHWNVGAGDGRVLNQRAEGFGHSESTTDFGADGADDTDLRLNIDLGAGDLEVTR